MSDEKIRKLIAAIESVETEKNNKYADTFSKVFDPIYKKLKSGAKQKSIIQILKDQGFEMSVATFRNLFEAECAMRGITIDTTKKGAARYQG